MHSSTIAAYLVLITAGAGLAQKNVVFDAPRRDSTGGFSGPTVLVAGDFNGDGIPDAVATAFASNLLSFYLGSAGGSPTASTSYGLDLPDVTTYPTAAVAVDLNRRWEIRSCGCPALRRCGLLERGTISPGRPTEYGSCPEGQ
jgi:hypothetical protein